MEWQLLGYNTYPFSVDPISAETIGLFTGHQEEVSLAQSVLHDQNVRLIIEGARGVGTTSFANYLKFSAQKKKLYLAPRDEVSVEKALEPRKPFKRLLFQQSLENWRLAMKVRLKTTKYLKKPKHYHTACQRHTIILV